MKRLGLLAIVVVAALLPAATASAGHASARIRLARVPLQAADFGAAGKSLALNNSSGEINDIGLIVVCSSTIGSNPTPGHCRETGPLGGFALDYGDPYTGGTGVTEIRSSVTAYRSPGDARSALEFGPEEAQFFAELFGTPFATETVKRAKPTPVGQRRFAVLTSKSVPGLNPIVSYDERVAAGRFVLDLTVTAGSASAAKLIAPHLVLLLHRRLQLMLDGQDLPGPPALLPRPTAGQALGGPDLSTLILQPSDVGQSHAVNLIQLYVPGPPALSDYEMLLAPAGTYTAVGQQIGWWPTATEATYAEAYGGGSRYTFLGFYGGTDPNATATPVDLSAVGDGAAGLIVTEDGQSTAYVRLTNGQAGETVVASSNGTLQASDVQSLAQAAADRLDAGLGP